MASIPEEILNRFFDELGALNEFSPEMLEELKKSVSGVQKPKADKVIAAISVVVKEPLS